MEMRGFNTNQVEDTAHNNAPQNNSNNGNPIPLQLQPPIPHQPVVRYGECLKNHAANMGGHVTDGCGEFMPSGEEGLMCAACDCHRSFHRRETVGGAEPPSGSAPPQYYPYNLNRSNNNLAHRATHGHVAQRPPAPAPPPPSQQRYGRAGGPPVMMTFGGGAVAESSSEEMDLIRLNQGGGQSSSKKRFRTKFTAEQKEKMREFGERIGWKIQKQNDIDVQQFCTEVGVKRQVFKVWMHNCNQASKKKQS